MFNEWQIRGIYSWDRLAVLGKNNIGYFLSDLRGTEKSHTKGIQDLHEQKNGFLEALKHSSGVPGNYFKDLAKKFDNPIFKENEIGLRSGSWSKDELEPLTKESENRKSWSTTFNMCGWCKHTGGGMCRFSYHIRTTCSLLSSFNEDIAGEKLEDSSDNKHGEIYSHRKLAFNNPCLLQKINVEQCEILIKNIEYNIDVQKARREGVREAIRKVQEFKAAAKGNKPWLVDYRPSEYVNVGDPLMVYLGGWKDKIVKGDWVEAVGIFGYRHQDGCISYQTLFPIHSDYSYLEGRGGGVGDGRPEVLLRSEFDYLHSIMSGSDYEKAGVENEDVIFIDVWFKSLFDVKELNVINFKKSLVKPDFAKPAKNWVPPSDEIRVKTVKDAQTVLCMLDADLFKTVKEIRAWANMQLHYVHPDRFDKASDEVKKYAERQTKAVYAARDLLIHRLDLKKTGFRFV